MAAKESLMKSLNLAAAWSDESEVPSYAEHAPDLVARVGVGT